eukprot:9809-Heterococcus_DN1.PRE.1
MTMIQRTTSGKPLAITHTAAAQDSFILYHPTASTALLALLSDKHTEFAENAQRSLRPNRNNTSGYANITARGGRFQVSVVYNNKAYFLGSRANIDEALHLRERGYWAFKIGPYHYTRKYKRPKPAAMFPHQSFDEFMAETDALKDNRSQAVRQSRVTGVTAHRDGWQVRIGRDFVGLFPDEQLEEAIAARAAAVQERNEAKARAHKRLHEAVVAAAAVTLDAI